MQYNRDSKYPLIILLGRIRDSYSSISHSFCHCILFERDQMGPSRWKQRNLKGPLWWMTIPQPPCPPPTFGDYKTLLNHALLDIDWEGAKLKPTIAAWIREHCFHQWALNTAKLSNPFFWGGCFFFFTIYFCLNHYPRKSYNYSCFVSQE